ncbi:ornithine decarboxylase-like [Synchiropus splendidus]|uniref:ornithine decarboxylase-like n=1 Tax=Synchiropus splendidus TaxID=270530 RepID=UPI00237DC96D|nr:ornithine decarboxylase-like [Synchiropus splendidus]
MAHRKAAPTLTGDATAQEDGHVREPSHELIEIVDDGVTHDDVLDAKVEYFKSVGSDAAFYLGNLDKILEHHFRWMNNLPRVKPYYALKSNTTEPVVRMLNALGTGFDCASKREIEMALAIGVPPHKIIYAHTIKSKSHLKYAYAQGVNFLTFDNEDELKKIACVCHKARIVLRIEVDDSSAMIKLSKKFGASMDKVPSLLETARKLHLNVVGVSFHVGVLCEDTSAFTKAIADSRTVFDIATAMGFHMELVDIGGGYDGKDTNKRFEKVAEVINTALDRYFPPSSGIQIIAEPGGFYAHSAFTLSVNVIGKKVERNGENSVPEIKGMTLRTMALTEPIKTLQMIVHLLYPMMCLPQLDRSVRCRDTNGEKSMAYYLNDGIHGSFSIVWNHPGYLLIEPHPHRAVEIGEPMYPSVLWGPTCDSKDKMVDDLMLPVLDIGEWLHFSNFGTYSITPQSDFNGMDHPDIYFYITDKTIRSLAMLVKASDKLRKDAE